MRRFLFILALLAFAPASFGAFGANAIWDVRGGADTNGGGFDPGATLAATDGTVDTNTGNTASPVFSSASYNFAAGDVSAWVFIKSGTSSIPGWYQIASVASNKATLSAAIGAGYEMVNNTAVRTNTAAGIATVGTPTSLTWAIDYSQQATAAATGTASSVTTTVTATTAIFNKGMVGNFITDGTTWKEITGYTSTTVVAVDSAPSWTAASVKVGGALATPGKAGGLKVAGNDIFVKSATYNLSTSSSNVAGGIVADSTGGEDQTNPTWWVGWNTNRYLYNADTSWPTINANLQTSLTLLSFTGAYTRVRNIIVDGNSKSSLTGLVQNSNYQKVDHLKAQNCTVIGLDLQGGNAVSAWSVSATTCSGTAGIRLSNTGAISVIGAEAYANTTSGFSIAPGGFLCNFISSANSGGSSCGVIFAGSVGANIANGVCYNNGADGVDCSASIGNITCTNVICENNAASGWNTGGVRGLVALVNCAGYNNTSGNFTATNLLDVTGFVNNTTGSFFTNAASGDFSLNSTANRGALARATGYPGVYPRGLTTGYLDIGAAQHQDSGGGGTTGIVRVFVP